MLVLGSALGLRGAPALVLARPSDRAWSGSPVAPGDLDGSGASAFLVPGRVVPYR